MSPCPGTEQRGSHPAFYDALMWPFERAVLRAWRRRLGCLAHGRVLEIGAGTGSQLRWYRAETMVTALEPDVAMAAAARRRAVAAPATVQVVPGSAEALPFDAGSFDTIVFSLTLCSVNDPQAALAEARRVLAPRGHLFMIEHVHLPWQPGRRLQSLSAPLWDAATGGCRIDRDTVQLVRAAGFDVVDLREHAFRWIVEVAAVAQKSA